MVAPDGVLLWMLGHVKDVCASDQPNNFTCPQGRVNYNSAVFWGGEYSKPLFQYERVTDTCQSHWTCTTLQYWTEVFWTSSHVLDRCTTPHYYIFSSKEISQ